MSPRDLKEEAAGAFPAAIVWDLDGTLVDSAPDLCTALNSLLREDGHPSHAVEDVRLMIGAGVPRLVERGYRGVGVELTDGELEERVARFMSVYRACATENTFLMPGARYALERFARAGVAQALCTNKPEAVTRQILDALDIARYFGSVKGGDSTPARKPDPMPLLACLEELAVTPRGAVMVGDSSADVGAARAAGVRVLVIPDGYSAIPAVELGADGIAGSVAEVPGAIADLGRITAAA